MKKWFSLSCILLMCIIASPVCAQEYIDTINTKDGSLYKGVIVENIINVSVKIELAGGSIINIPYENIFSIGKEKKEKSEITTGNVPKIRRNQRPIAYMETFRYAGDTSNYAFLTKAQFAWGYFHLETYLGVGFYEYVNAYDEYDDSTTFTEPGVSVGLGIGPYFPLGKWGAITLTVGSESSTVINSHVYTNVGLRLYFHGSNEAKKGFSMELNGGVTYDFLYVDPYISLGFGYSYYRVKRPRS